MPNGSQTSKKWHRCILRLLCSCSDFYCISKKPWSHHLTSPTKHRRKVSTNFAEYLCSMWNGIFCVCAICYILPREQIYCSLGPARRMYHLVTQGKKATVNQVTTILSTSKNVLFPPTNYQCWWPFTLITATAPHTAQCEAGGYDLETGHY